MAIAEIGDKGEVGAGVLVAFDFDGTLTIRDSFTQFLAWRASPSRLCLGAWRLLPAALRYVSTRDRDALKAATVGEFLRGMARATLEDEAERFATACSSRLLRPDGVEAWKTWRASGARLVIVTASPETIVAPFARALGADRLIGSRLAFDAEDRVAGGFDGPNCRGPEKVVRLREAFGDDVDLAAAYGDSVGDREMLGLAQAPHYRVLVGRP